MLVQDQNAIFGCNFLIFSLNDFPHAFNPWEFSQGISFYRKHVAASLPHNTTFGKSYTFRVFVLLYGTSHDIFYSYTGASYFNFPRPHGHGKGTYDNGYVSGNSICSTSSLSAKKKFVRLCKAKFCSSHMSCVIIWSLMNYSRITDMEYVNGLFRKPFFCRVSF